MSHQRDDESRLVEIDAALELLRPIKEDTVSVILSLEKNRERKSAKSVGASDRPYPAQL